MGTGLHWISEVIQVIQVAFSLDLEEVHIFADGLNKKGANGEAEMSVFALSGLPKFSEKARCARLCQAGRADTHTSGETISHVISRQTS